jgi:hypothetical protein
LALGCAQDRTATGFELDGRELALSGRSRFIFSTRALAPAATVESISL